MAGTPIGDMESAATAAQTVQNRCGPAARYAAGFVGICMLLVRYEFWLKGEPVIARDRAPLYGDPSPRATDAAPVLP
jgi:hypothetical protein